MTVATPPISAPPPQKSPPRPAPRPLPTFVHRKPSLDVSVTGLVYMSMIMFLGLAAINSQANLLFGVFGLMIGILLISGVVSQSVLRRLRVRRTLPDHATVGRPAVLTYEFSNEKRFWPSLSVSFAELDGADPFTRQPQAYLLHAAPGHTARVPIRLIPRRRGIVNFDTYQLSTSFPFGFIKRAVDRHQRDTLLVYPPLGKVDSKVIQLLRSTEKTGALMRPRSGGADEFYGVKEYRSGENPRWIYWRRSARTGTLVSKEMTQVSPPKMVLLVDTYNPNPSDLSAAADVERVIAMAASLADHALESNLTVGLFAWAGQWVSIVPNRGKRHRRDLLSLFARLPHNTQMDAAALVQGSYDAIKTGATPVLFTPSTAKVGLADHLRLGMLVFSPSSPQTSRYFSFAPDIDFAACSPDVNTTDAINT